MPELAPHRLVISTSSTADLYVAFFESASHGQVVASLCRSLADLDAQGAIFGNWRTFLEALFRDCMSEMTGYPRESIELQRSGFVTVAMLREGA